MNFNQILLAQEGIGGDSGQRIVAEVDVSHSGQNREDVQLRDGVDTGIDIFQIIIIPESVIIAHGIDIVGMYVQNFQTGWDEGIVKPEEVIGRQVEGFEGTLMSKETINIFQLVMGQIQLLQLLEVFKSIGL